MDDAEARRMGRSCPPACLQMVSKTVPTSREIWDGLGSAASLNLLISHDLGQAGTGW